MFNEAFMFFWLVSFCVSTSILAAFSTIIFGSVLLLTAMFNVMERPDQQPKKFIKWLLIGLAVSAFLSVVIPPKSAFYAGATQYVGEATEIDQTLLRLKEVIDTKIEEMEDE